MASIQFSMADTNVTLLNKNKLRVKIGDIFQFNGVEFESLQYVFCSDAFLLDINRRFLHHDYYTDIITFNLSEDKKRIMGEIYISIDRVKENAVLNKVSFKEELHRVVFHGVLHLCGFKDKSKMDRKAMRNAEDFWIRNYFGST